MTQRIKVLVFDLDDTLYPERQFVLSGFKAADEWLRLNRGVQGFLNAAATHFENGLRGTVFNAALRDLALEDAPELIGKLISIYRSHSPAITLFDDAAKVLARCSGKVPTAMITDGYLETQRKKVIALNLQSFFRTIIYSDLFGREFWKPHARPYNAISTELACSPTECTYVADNPHKDFVTAKKLGWQTIRIRRPMGEHASIELSPDYEAHFQIASLVELEPLLS